MGNQPPAPTASPTATAAPETPTPTASMDESSDASTPAATVTANSLAMTSLRRQGGDSGGLFGPMTLAGTAAALLLAGIILAGLVLRRNSVLSPLRKFSPHLPGRAFTPIPAQAPAILSAGAASSPMFQSMPATPAQTWQQTVSPEPGPSHFPLGNFAPLVGDSMTLEALAAGAAGNQQAAYISDMNPLALDFRQFVDQRTQEAEESAGATSSSALSSPEEEQTAAVLCLPDSETSVLRSEKDEKQEVAEGAESGDDEPGYLQTTVLIDSSGPLEDAFSTAIANDVDSVDEADTVTNSDTAWMNSSRPSGPQAIVEILQASPSLPWDIQSSAPDEAQSDPLLRALKRQVQMGLFAVPDRESEEHPQKGEVQES